MLSGMANSIDPDQTAPFAYVILSDTLVFEILGHLPQFVVLGGSLICSANYSRRLHMLQSHILYWLRFSLYRYLNWKKRLQQTGRLRVRNF